MPPVMSSATRRGDCACSTTTPHAISSTPTRPSFMAGILSDNRCIFPRMSVHIVPHPLIHDALIQLRDVNTTTEEFRRTANRISVLLVAEALRDLPTEREIGRASCRERE